jgi:hypothetical protein
VLITAPAAAQRDPVRFTPQQIERELHDDGGRRLDLCRRVQSAAGLGVSFAPSGERLVEWCRGGMSTPLAPTAREAGRQEMLDALRTTCPSVPNPPETPAYVARQALEAPESSPPDGFPWETAAPEVNLASIALEGLAQFVQNRARAEVQVFMVNRLREELCPNGVALRLLPATCAYLGQGGDLFSASFGPSFIAAVGDDAVHLPRNLSATFEPPRSGGRGRLVMRASLELLATMTLSIDVTRNALAVRDVVAGWNCLEDANCIASQRVQRFALSAVAAALREPHTNNEPQRAPEALVEALNNLWRELNPGAQVPARGEMDGFFRESWNLQRQVRALHDARDEAERNARVEPVAAAVVALITRGADLVDWDRAHPRLPASLASFLSAVARRSLADVIVQAARIIRDVARSLPGPGSPGVEIPEGVLRVLNLGADLAAARSAEQVSAVIETFAAPVGSWRLKSRNRFSIWLNGAFGLAGGEEYTRSHTDSSGVSRPGEWASQGQFFAPLGVDLSWGVSASWHLGFFVSLVDVGALAPLSSNSADTSFNALSFVAPGLYLRFGVPEVPLLFGLGASHRPFARTVTVDGADQSLAATTVSAFVAVDIPIFSFVGIPRRSH